MSQVNEVIKNAWPRVVPLAQGFFKNRSPSSMDEASGACPKMRQITRSSNHQAGSARAGSIELSVWRRFAGREAATITQSGSVWQALSTTAQTRRRAPPSIPGVEWALRSF
jgi:hypothetical protein